MFIKIKIKKKKANIKWNEFFLCNFIYLLFYLFIYIIICMKFNKDIN